MKEYKTQYEKRIYQFYHAPYYNAVVQIVWHKFSMLPDKNKVVAIFKLKLKH